MKIREAILSPSESSSRGENKNQDRKPRVLFSWLSYLKSVVLGILFIGATAKVALLCPHLAFFALGFFVSLTLGELLASVIISVGISLIGALLFQMEGIGLAPVLLFSLFPLVSLLGALAGHIMKKNYSRQNLVLFLLILILFNFLVQGFVVSRDLVSIASREPPAESYRFDPIFFLKVSYLMRGGEGFYASFDQAFRADARFDQPYTTLTGWRSPVIFYIWSTLFPSGAGLVYAFILLALLSILASYYVAREISDEASALVTPALLGAYFLFALPSWWFLELEFWAVFIAIFSAFFFSQKKKKLSLGLAILSGSIREWLVSSVFAGLFCELREKKWKKALPWLLSFLLLVLFYLVNAMLVARYLQSVGLKMSLGTEGRLGSGGIGFILYTLQFCSRFFLGPGFIPYLAFFLALAVAIYLLKNGDYYLPSLLLFPLLFFLFIGSGKGLGDPPGWNDYYNASFMPFVFILAPAFWKLFLPGELKVSK